MVGSFLCCAHAANGHIAAPPTSVMKSRRFIRSSIRSPPARAGLQNIGLVRISQEITATNRQGPFRGPTLLNEALDREVIARCRQSSTYSLHTCLSFVVLVGGSGCLLTGDLGAGTPFKKFFD
jgi:hypothetical protein